MEDQEIQVNVPRTITETHTRYVPRTVLVPVEVEVPKIIHEQESRTIQVPRTIMEEKTIDVPRPVYETVTRTVQRPRTVMEDSFQTVMQPRTIQVSRQVPVETVQKVQRAVTTHRQIEVPAMTMPAATMPAATMPVTTMQQPYGYPASYGGYPASYGYPVTSGSAAPKPNPSSVPPPQEGTQL